MVVRQISCTGGGTFDRVHRVANDERDHGEPGAERTLKLTIRHHEHFNQDAVAHLLPHFQGSGWLHTGHLFTKLYELVFSELIPT
jgi:hypothetical protein